LYGRSELQRFKNEEGRREEGDKGQARMIPGEGERGAGMKGGVASCPPTRRCLEELLKQLAALIYSYPFETRKQVYMLTRDQY
jgi:hypothetical protein